MWHSLSKWHFHTKETKSVKISSIVRNFAWCGEMQASVPLLPCSDYALWGGDKDGGYLYGCFSHSKLCHNCFFWLTLWYCAQNAENLLCCLDYGIVALDLVEYYGFMKATASYSTCRPHLDDLKTEFWACIQL